MRGILVPKGVKTYLRWKTHCITRPDKQTVRREERQQTKKNQSESRPGQEYGAKNKVNEGRNRSMLAERVHVVDMSAGI